MKHVVYWIYDDSCKQFAGGPAEYGYVGVAMKHRFHSRMLEHRRSKRFPSNFQIMILLEDHAEGAYLYEFVLRPKANIGWNKAPGGARGARLGIKKSEETKRKIGEANKGNKRPDLALFNKTFPQTWKSRTCIYCGKTGKGPNMTRYHFNNCKKNETNQLA